MPRIKAESVAAHRENQERRLLDAAKHVLLTDGPQAVTPGAVAKHAGISRPAVYQYFDNGVAMIERVVLDDFHKTLTQIQGSVAGQTEARSKAHAYVLCVINQASQGMHLSATALSNFPMPADFKTQIDALHRRQIEPLVAALGELGISGRIELALIGGLVETGVRLVEAGASPEPVIAAVCRQIDAALATA
jgi:AcrR family transcriptional regulator